MKRICSLLLTVVIVFGVLTSIPITVSAATSGLTGDCTWLLNGTVLTISGSGEMDSYHSASKLPWGKEITELIIEHGVTNIGDFAFAFCTDLTSVTIPDSVTCIGQESFVGCTFLTSIKIPDSVSSINYRTFYSCTNLSSVDIGNGVTSIGSEAFQYCTNLTFVKMSDSVTDIQDYAFNSCASLKSFIIPNSVKYIGRDVFSGCTSLTSITIPNNVTSIGINAFNGCSALDYVFYTGSKSDWANIIIGDCNESLNNAIIHYGSTDHTYEYKVDIEATCTNEGLEHQECIVCGYCLDIGRAHV